MTMLFFLGTPALLFVVGLAFARYALTHDPSLSAGHTARFGKELHPVSALAQGQWLCVSSAREQPDAELDERSEQELIHSWPAHVPTLGVRAHQGPPSRPGAHGPHQLVDDCYTAYTGAPDSESLAI